MMLEMLIAFGVLYCLVDFILGMCLGRCVMPGLRCGACRPPRGAGR